MDDKIVNDKPNLDVNEEKPIDAVNDDNESQKDDNDGSETFQELLKTLELEQSKLQELEKRRDTLYKDMQELKVEIEQNLEASSSKDLKMTGSDMSFGSDTYSLSIVDSQESIDYEFYNEEFKQLETIHEADEKDEENTIAATADSIIDQVCEDLIEEKENLSLEDTTDVCSTKKPMIPEAKRD